MAECLRTDGAVVLDRYVPLARIARFQALLNADAQGGDDPAPLDDAAFARRNPGAALIDLLPAPQGIQLFQAIWPASDFRCTAGWYLPGSQAPPPVRGGGLFAWLPLPGDGNATAATAAAMPGDLLLLSDPPHGHSLGGPGILLCLAPDAEDPPGVAAGLAKRHRTGLLELVDQAVRLDRDSHGAGGTASMQAAGDLVIHMARLMRELRPEQVLPDLWQALSEHGLLPEATAPWSTPDGTLVEPAADTAASALPTRPVAIGLCMSVRDHAEVVGRALDGLAAQERPFDQIVLVDDGSRDDSHARLCDFARDRTDTIVLRNEEPLGAVGGIRRAEAELETAYLVWAAADDLLLPNAAARLADAAAAYPRAALVVGETGLIRREDLPSGQIGAMKHGGGMFSDMPGFVAPDCLPQILSCRRLSVGTAWMMRRDALAAIGGFDPALGPLADFYATLALACRWGFAVIPERLSVMTVDGASFSRRAGRDPEAMAGFRDTLIARLRLPENADLHAAIAATPSLILELQAEAELFTTYFAHRPQHWDLMLRALYWGLRHGEISISRGA